MDKLSWGEWVLWVSVLMGEWMRERLLDSKLLWCSNLVVAVQNDATLMDLLRDSTGPDLRQVAENVLRALDPWIELCLTWQRQGQGEMVDIRIGARLQIHHHCHRFCRVSYHAASVSGHHPVSPSSSSCWGSAAALCSHRNLLCFRSVKGQHLICMWWISGLVVVYVNLLSFICGEEKLTSKKYWHHGCFFWCCQWDTACTVWKCTVELCWEL